MKKVVLSKPINEQGVFYYSTSGKYTVRVKVKNKFTNLAAFSTEAEAKVYLNKWVKENP